MIIIIIATELYNHVYTKNVPCCIIHINCERCAREHVDYNNYECLQTWDEMLHNNYALLCIMQIES